MLANKIGFQVLVFAQQGTACAGESVLRPISPSVSMLGRWGAFEILPVQDCLPYTSLNGFFWWTWECMSKVERMLRWGVCSACSEYASLSKALTGMSPRVSPGLPRLTWEVPQAVQKTAVDCGGADWVRGGGERGAALASWWPEISRRQGSSWWPKSLCPAAAAAADGSGRSEWVIFILVPHRKIAISGHAMHWVNSVPKSSRCLKVPRNTCIGSLWTENFLVAFEHMVFSSTLGSVLATRMANRQFTAHQQFTRGNGVSCSIAYMYLPIS